MKKILFYLSLALVLGALSYFFYVVRNQPVTGQTHIFAGGMPLSGLFTIPLVDGPFETLEGGRQDQSADDPVFERMDSPFGAPVDNEKTNKIRSLLGRHEPIDIRYLDRTVSSLLRDRDMLRSEKISALLNLAEEFGLDSEKSHYLLDTLGSLRPIEIADVLIDKITDDKVSDATKILVMRMLADSYGIDPARLSPEAARLVADQSIGIQAFFTELLQNPTGGPVYKQAIKLYPSVSSATETAILNESLMSHRHLITDQESLSARLDASLANSFTQQHLLIELLNDVQNGAFSFEAKQNFNDRLYSVINSPSAGKIINDAVKPRLESYLLEQEPVLTTANCEFNAVHEYSAWMRAYAFLVSHGDKSMFIADHIATFASPIQQAAVIAVADPDLLNRLQKNPNFRMNMAEALADPQLTLEAATVIQTALQRLQKPN